MVISEPDGSFSAKDVYLLLEQIENYDAVFTTRTYSNMKFYLRFGNKIYGLLISFLFRGPILTDAGSSFRIFKKKKLKEIIPRLKSDGPELQMELTTSLMINKAKIIETKVNYKKRKGKSNYTGNFYDSFKVLIVFTKVIILKFLGFLKCFFAYSLKIFKPNSRLILGLKVNSSVKFLIDGHLLFGSSLG